jgi:hypothetical protein
VLLYILSASSSRHKLGFGETYQLNDLTIDDILSNRFDLHLTNSLFWVRHDMQQSVDRSQREGRMLGWML